MSSSFTSVHKFIDIGANLTDPVFHGVYRGKKCHDDDFRIILNRAREVGVQSIIVTAGTLKDTKQALHMCREYGDSYPLYSTAGVHPTRCDEFDRSGSSDEHMNNLLNIAYDGMKDGKIVAVGEIGLDYDRLQFCSAEVQRKYFEMQIARFAEMKLPLFLHMRAAGSDFLDIIQCNRSAFSSGVVHSFTGTDEELRALLAAGLYIGINGCSLKTEDNIRVASTIPLDRLMLETDAPWCEVKRTHAGHKFVEPIWDVKKKERWQPDACVKARCEPCHIIHVAQVLAGVMGKSVGDVCEAAYSNTVSVFGIE